ncbi:hypothetical protein OII53_15625 [Achromobacter ruhlandii]|jgi:conjugal transfer/entry exclusion protein|uniref:hypothetical protein n=1 Tax=Achromobacter ruhlandii TaxID=72557 RepID=UPI0015834995|nr:hypothetical protein [Achromobacter ruhlandii]MCI1838441.1 hypothetical protein [Achromobacter ruhlandii]MCV6795435.1 hypothetical protein [Achromobacter ruhlandii]MCV6802394.1 hypothetical protein [Achromobacter ruhlandii]MCV6809892.1 hypothetical protein [Achromobacter ruhlandii]MCV6819972.1 hypothetical protein [Achromobacter ruhlandii]
MSMSPSLEARPAALAVSASSTQVQTRDLEAAVRLERYLMLQDKVRQQAGIVQGLNDQLRLLGQEKASLVGDVSLSQASQGRLLELDDEINRLVALQTKESVRLREMSAKLAEAMEAVNAVQAKLFDTSSSVITNLR